MNFSPIFSSLTKIDLEADIVVHNSTAGKTYSQIVLASGALNLGAGLSFDAFDFNMMDGFAPGTYVLIKTGEPIRGSLGNATGNLGSRNAELVIKGTDLVLQVKP